MFKSKTKNAIYFIILLFGICFISFNFVIGKNPTSTQEQILDKIEEKYGIRLTSQQLHQYMEKFSLSTSTIETYLQINQPPSNASSPSQDTELYSNILEQQTDSILNIFREKYKNLIPSDELEEILNELKEQFLNEPPEKEKNSKKSDKVKKQFLSPAYFRKNLTLIWSTNTYVPDAYPGKPLPTEGSVVEVIADINPNIDTHDLIFRWFLDNEVIPNKSGLGKSVFQFKVKKSPPDRYFLGLEVRTKQEKLIGEKYISIPVVEPQLVVRDKYIPGKIIHPGVTFHSFQKLTLQAVPYFFNITKKEDLNYKWAIAGIPGEYKSNENPNLINIKIDRIKRKEIKDFILEVFNKKISSETGKFIASIVLMP